MSRLTLLFTMALCLTWPLQSQVRGHVWDQSGGAPPGATIILKSSSGKEIAKVFADHDGAYSLNADGGQYSIEATFECFVTVRYKPFYTIGGRIQSLDFVLPHRGLRR